MCVFMLYLLRSNLIYMYTSSVNLITCRLHGKVNLKNTICLWLYAGSIMDHKEEIRTIYYIHDMIYIIMMAAKKKITRNKSSLCIDNNQHKAS